MPPLRCSVFLKRLLTSFCSTLLNILNSLATISSKLEPLRLLIRLLIEAATNTMYLLVVLLAVAFGQVAQLDPNNFPDKLRTSEWLMVYVYSPTCGHCKDFTPLYEKLANQLKDNVEFGKIDGNMYTDFGTKYKVTSFPTVMLFYSGIDLPLTYFDERKVSKIKEWIQEKMSFELPLKT